MKKKFEPQFDLPRLKYNKKPKKMVSWRLTEDLLTQLQATAEKSGLNVTDFVSIALEQAILWTKKNRK